MGRFKKSFIDNGQIYTFIFSLISSIVVCVICGFFIENVRLNTYYMEYSIFTFWMVFIFCSMLHTSVFEINTIK